MSVRRPPTDKGAAPAPARPGGNPVYSFADVLRVGLATSQSTASRGDMLAPALSTTGASPAVGAYPPVRRPLAMGPAHDAWASMYDYVLRCVLSLQNDGVIGTWPFAPKKDVWSVLDPGASTELHDRSLAPYASLMVLRSSDSNTQYGEPYRFVMRPSTNQEAGRFIMCEDRAPGLPSGQKKTMWYFEIDSLVINGAYTDYPAGEHFITFGMTLRPANKEWDAHKLTTPAPEAQAKGYTFDHDYSKYDSWHEEKHPDANKPRLQRLEYDPITGEPLKRRTVGVKRTEVTAGLEWFEALEKLMDPKSRSGLLSLRGTVDDPATRHPLIPTPKRSDFWLSSVAHPAAPGKMAFSTSLVHALSNAIMRAIAEKVSSTWPQSIAEWAADKARAERAARLPPPMPLAPRQRRRYHDDEMTDAYIEAGEEDTAPDDTEAHDPSWGNRRR